MTTASNTNPWKAVWTRPRAAVRVAVQQGRTAEMYLLAALGGIYYTLENFSGAKYDPSMELSRILAGWLLSGAIIGLVGLFVTVIVVHWAARWLGGQASFQASQQAYAWSFVPLVPVLVFTFVLIGMYGEAVFAGTTPTVSSRGLDLVPMVGYLGVTLVLMLWSWAVFLQAFAEVHRFSIWRALGAVVFPVAVLALGVAVLVAIMGDVAG